MRLKKQLTKHVALIAALVMAGSAFGLNIILKAELDPLSYSNYALNIFLVSTLFIFGCCGFEQVITRLSKLNEGELRVPKEVMILGLVILLFSPVLSFYLMFNFSLINEFSFKYIVLAWLVGASTILAVVYKIQGLLLLSYLITGLWKVTLILVLPIFILLNAEIDFLMIIMLSILAAFIITLTFKWRKLLKFQNCESNWKNISLYALAGFFSVLSVFLFDSLDRVIINSLHSPEDFGEYFFIYTFFMAPLMIVSNYYAGSRMPNYKINFSFQELKLDLIKSSCLSLSVLIAFYFILQILIFNEIVEIKIKNKYFFFILTCFCLMKGAYLLLSMSYSLVCSSKALFNISVFFIFLSIFTYILTTVFIKKISLLHILVFILFFWILRCFIYYYYIRYKVKLSRVKL